ncbi:hypothetical protein HanRHA438_Chr14g0632291 [Helianthus annuus]|nr:hypothetical protein HanHA89_Chr14g0541491 [Helianthus annuus]KAJ0851916.1 hypothetical protein HanRHA438_Chr14g0632291 [Helianthus annuus]
MKVCCIDGLEPRLDIPIFAAFRFLFRAYLLFLICFIRWLRT